MFCICSFVNRSIGPFDPAMLPTGLSWQIRSSSRRRLAKPKTFAPQLVLAVRAGGEESGFCICKTFSLASRTARICQLALYALSSSERISVMFYPTVDAAAREQQITIQEPVHGVSKATVILRPLNLAKLDQLLRDGLPSQLKRVKLAERLYVVSWCARCAHAARRFFSIRI